MLILVEGSSLLLFFFYFNPEGSQSWVLGTGNKLCFPQWSLHFYNQINSKSDILIKVLRHLWWVAVILNIIQWSLSHLCKWKVLGNSVWQEIAPVSLHLFFLSLFLSPFAGCSIVHTVQLNSPLGLWRISVENITHLCNTACEE